MWDFMFFFNSILLGAGLAMDAFSVSLANGLHENTMSRTKMCGVAGVFAFFQTLMPLVGWLCVHTILQYFNFFQKFVPWIALTLLAFIGGKMIADGIKLGDENQSVSVGLPALFAQGIATSIDALSVGFTIAEYTPAMALIYALLIGAVTFAICMCGLFLGKKFGTKFTNKANVFGGIILILVGLEIFVTGLI